jgi:hypothetical protein
MVTLFMIFWFSKSDYILQPADDPTDETYPKVFEEAIDRLACAVGGQALLPPAFQYIPSMLASYDWRLRHAGLMAIASIGEGTSKVTKGLPLYRILLTEQLSLITGHAK